MNKKILVISFFLLALPLITIPVMGAPATKIEGVTATLDVTPSMEGRMVDDGILHVKGTASGEVILDIPGIGVLEGTMNAEVIGKIKFEHPEPGPWPEAVGRMRGKMVWTFTGMGTTGTFEGVRYNEYLGYPTSVRSHRDSHMVLRGTGDFAGQTLKLSYEGPEPIALEGTLIIPK